MSLGNFDAEQVYKKRGPSWRAAFFMAKLDTLPSYRPALDALRTLKGTLGATPEIKAIAAYLIESSEGEIGRSGFPYVGDPADPRDRAVVEAHQDYWRRFMDGEELEENWHEL